jgi:8-oxo-dGTP pyrophosphatase MutT (NUDIX family)
MSEIIDIYDEKFKFIRTCDKKLAHQKGFWHKSFICIVFNPKKKTAILQMKVPGRYSFNRPDYLDFSVGGHYRSGELVKDGVREIKEELGIDIDFNNLISLGIRKKSAHVAKDFIENEFQYIFLLPSKIDIKDYPIDNTEVNRLVEVDIDSALMLLRKEVKSINVSIMKMKNDIIEVNTTEIDLNSFVPSYLNDKLYERLFIQVKKYLNKQELDKWNLNE